MVVSEPCWGPRRPLFCSGPTGIWVKADYLQWWEQGTHVPALVTTGPERQSIRAISASRAPQVLFGDDYINNKSVSGGRIQAGLWLNPCATFGFEGEFFALADENTNYYLWSTVRTATRSSPGRSTTLTRPAPGQAVEYVAFPRGNTNSVDGAINISAITRFHGAGRTSSSPLAARKAAGPTTALLHDLPRPLPRGLCRRLSLPGPGGSTRHHGNPHDHVNPRRTMRQNPNGTLDAALSWSTTSSTRRTRSTAAIWA